MCKIEIGEKNDILVGIANLFMVSLDFLVCDCKREAETDSLLAGLNERELQFICNMVLNASEKNIILLM